MGALDSLAHARRVNDARAAADRQAMKDLRPDQRAYYAHLLRSWRTLDDSWLGWNAEGRALRKTLGNRP